MSEQLSIACELCGAQQDNTMLFLARHLRDDHAMLPSQAIALAKEMRIRNIDKGERIRQAAPELLKELETAIAWIEQIESYEIFDPSAPSKHGLLPQLRAAIKKARGE